MVEGFKLNLGCGQFEIPGFINLDASNGWRYEDGLKYPDNTVRGITISHSLMYVHDEDWPFVFSELARVLTKDGVIRITEDSTTDPRSERYGGHFDAVSMTTPEKVKEHMEGAGLRFLEVDEKTTYFEDASLIQNLHGGIPKAFFCEGIHV